MLKKPGGFLLIEALIASVILTVAVAAVTTLMVSAADTAETGRQAGTAAALGTQLLEEIAAKPLCYPAGTAAPVPAPAVRSQFGIVGQYDGYADTTAAVATAAGTTVSPGDGEVYRRSVTVTYGAGPVTSAAPNGEFATVTVTVTTPRGRQISVSRLIGHVDVST